MKGLKIFLITLLINLITSFIVYPKIVFADNSATVLSTQGSNFPVLFALYFTISVVLAFLIYIIGEIINRK